MYLSIMQPTYLPWVGYFELIHKAEYFVFFDDVQFVKKSWHHRNKIATPCGELMLTVPVLSKGKRFQLLNQVQINNNEKWRKKHLKSIAINYSKSKYFDKYYNELETFYSKQYEFLVDLNIDIISFLCNCLGIETKFYRSSILDIDGEREKKIINIIKYFD